MERIIGDALRPVSSQHWLITHRPIISVVHGDTFACQHLFGDPNHQPVIAQTVRMIPIARNDSMGFQPSWIQLVQRQGQRQQNCCEYVEMRSHLLSVAQSASAIVFGRSRSATSSLQSHRFAVLYLLLHAPSFKRLKNLGIPFFIGNIL